MARCGGQDSVRRTSSQLVLGTYPQATGDAAVTRMRLAVDVPPEATQFVRDWLTEKYDVRL